MATPKAEAVTKKADSRLTWQGYSASTTDADARSLYCKRYGHEPRTIKRTGGAVLAGQLGRYVGLDEVSLETDVDTAESELVLGKFLSPRLYVSYGISLSDAINTFKARYTIGDRWVISGEAGQEASADIEYTIDR